LRTRQLLNRSKGKVVLIFISVVLIAFSVISTVVTNSLFHQVEDLEKELAQYKRGSVDGTVTWRRRAYR